jgi:cAMP-binding proteins - catabolite gene activator and regulatory subunit of cAMP-dependent protein kinases
MKKILVIEDNLDVRENLAEILALRGYDVLTAENGKQGVAIAKEALPDLILCDIMMPELDGYGALHILSHTASTADIPFIFLTAKAEKEDFRRGMSLGADDYITKPFDDVSLMQTVESRLQKSERLRAASAQPSGGILERFIDEARAMEAIQHLSDNRELRHYKKKDLIFREGELPRWLYFVESGKVKIYKTSEDGREFIVKVAQAGDFLGFLALFKEDAYPESAAALEDCSIKLVPKQDFAALVFGNRDVNARFIKMLAGHIADREQQLIELAYNSVRKRVATALAQLCEQSGPTIQLLREDLAALAGTAKETLIRTLTDFKNEGLIEIKDGVVTVAQLGKLKGMPN